MIAGVSLGGTRGKNNQRYTSAVRKGVRRTGLTGCRACVCDGRIESASGVSGNLPTRVAPDPDVSRLLATNYGHARKFRTIFFVTVKDPRHFFKHVWPVRVWAKCFLCTWKTFKTLKQLHWSHCSARRRRSSFLATRLTASFHQRRLPGKKCFSKYKHRSKLKRPFSSEYIGSTSERTTPGKNHYAQPERDSRRSPLVIR